VAPAKPTAEPPLAYACGRATLLAQDEAAVVERMMEVLRAIFDVDVPAPTHTFVSR
jgi:hypothetical protein